MCPFHGIFAWGALWPQANQYLVLKPTTPQSKIAAKASGAGLKTPARRAFLLKTTPNVTFWVAHFPIPIT
jgi:hypothetical protein